MSMTKETTHLLAPSSSEAHSSNYTTPNGESTEMKPLSDATNSQTGEEDETIDFKEFGLPDDTMCGMIEHSTSKKIQKFIRFRFNKDDYSKKKENGKNLDSKNDGKNDDNSDEGSKNNENNTNDSNGNKENEIDHKNNINNINNDTNSSSKEGNNNDNSKKKENNNDGDNNNNNNNNDDKNNNNSDNNKNNNSNENKNDKNNSNSNNDNSKNKEKNNDDNNNNNKNNNDSNNDKNNSNENNNNNNNDNNNNNNNENNNDNKNSNNNNDNDNGNNNNNESNNDIDNNINNNNNNNDINNSMENNNDKNNSNNNSDENKNYNNSNNNNKDSNNDNSSKDDNSDSNSNKKNDSNGDKNTINNNDTNNGDNKNDDNKNDDNKDNNEGNTNSNSKNTDDDNENNDENNKDNSCYTELGKILYKFITEYWEVDPPEYVLSLVGFSQNLPNDILRNIIISLKAITRIKGPWSIGQAVEYSDNANACGEGNKDNLNICIGFVSGRDIKENRIVKSENDQTKFKFEFQRGKININPNYTHIIIVDDVDIGRLQTALTCSLDCFSFIIPVHSQNRELHEISRVSEYSEIVKEAKNYDIYLTLLDYDAKDERVLTYAGRARWKLWDIEENDKDKELERMIKERYKKKHELFKKRYEEIGLGILAEEDYSDDVEKTYKQTVKIIRNFMGYQTVSAKSDHLFQNEILKEMRYSKRFQSVCLAMAWEVEDASYLIDTYYERYVYKYKKEKGDQNKEKKIEELRRDMLLASLLSGKLKHVQHVMKVFGIPKLTKRFLEDLYNASILVHKPCVNWQEYSDMKSEGGGDDDGNNSGVRGFTNNDVSDDECPYSANDVYETCLLSNADYTKLEAIILTDKESIPDSVKNGEENPSKARLRWAKLRKLIFTKNETFPKSIIDGTDPSKALFKWAVLHSLDDIALELLQTSNDFKHQLEMLLVAVAIIFRLRKNAQELKTGEEVCIKRLQRYSNICRVFMATSYEEGQNINVDDHNVRFALENRDVFGQEFVEDFASSEAVQESIQEKWRGDKEDNTDKRVLYTVYRNCDTPQMKFYVHSLFYFVFLTFLSYLAVIKLRERPHKLPTSPLDLCFESPMCVFCAVYSLLYVLSYIGMEINQFCEIMKRFEDDPWYGARSYLFDKWNLLDWLCILFFIAVIPLVTTSYTYEVGRVMLAVDVSFWILRILQILKYLEKTGMWIEMLWKMFLDMLKFLIILVIFLFAFGIAMMSMTYPGTDFVESVVKKPYFTIYGETFLEDLEKVSDPLVKLISIVYVGVYLLVANTLVLNVLIAVFNDSYNNVKAKGTKIWKLSRYDLLQEYRTRPVLPPPFAIFELIILICIQRRNNEEVKDHAIDKILTQKSWMDKKTKKDDKKPNASAGDEGSKLNDDSADSDVSQQCLGLAIEQITDDSLEVSNYEIKAQLIKKLDEQQNNLTNGRKNPMMSLKINSNN